MKIKDLILTSRTMCGIFGYIGNKTLQDEKIINSLSKRGPDNSATMELSTYNNKTCKIFHTRLSIIDLSDRSNQPFKDKEGRFIITYNGEIYNFNELKKELVLKGYDFFTTSDTEVLLNAYIEWGERILMKLRGMFAFGIYDKKENKWFLARDPFGIKPMYYYCNNEFFVFSSLLIPILTSGVNNNFTINKTAINDYLSMGSFIPPDTIFNEIKVLKPGNCLIYKKNKISTKKYFNYKELFYKKKITDYNIALKNVRNTVIDSVEMHFISDVPVGVLLSGGIDSSVIAGISSKILKKKINTYSVGYKNEKFKKIDETNIATKTAEFIGSNHENILIDYDDFNSLFFEFMDSIDVPSIDGFNTFIISKKIAKRVKVVLSGLGGDEMFAGYPVFKELFYLKNNTSSFDNLLKLLPHKFLTKINKQYLNYLGKDLTELLINKRNLSHIKDTTRKKIDNYLIDSDDIIDIATNYEVQQYMSNTLLRDSDAVSMFSGLEMRVPFVDKEIFKLTASISGKYKISNTYNKPLLVDSFRDILLPDVYLTPKRGFALPIPEWASKVFELKKFDFLDQDMFYQKTGISKKKLFSEYVNNTHNDYNKHKWLIFLVWIDKFKNYIL